MQTSTLQGKRILIGVTGSIAAYKIAILTRLLVKQGVAVKIVMTDAAKSFITPLTLSTLSKNEVYSSVSSEESWHNHVELGLWADAMLIAPATANTLAKMANGHCDNMLLATYLSSRCPVFFAPAMDLDMWKHPAVQQNIDKLISFGNQLIPVEDGELASGLYGKGRMAEPTHIIDYLEQFFTVQIDDRLQGKKVLITSGPTVESIDPVRFISNHSTGRMGSALAETAAQFGAEVTFVSGPAKVTPQHTSIHQIDVQSAAEMYAAAKEHFATADVIILAAAVADYTPATVAEQKMKKKEGDLHIALKRTTDIAATLGKQKKTNQVMVGFALETNDALQHAQRKVESKNLDFIVLNILGEQGAAFGHQTNKVTFIERNGQIQRYDIKSKQEVAKDIINKVCSLLDK